MTRPRSGVRRVDDLSNGGRIVWLYGETDLDDVLLELARTNDETWTETQNVVRPGAEWPNDRSRTILAGATDGDGLEAWGREFDAAHVTVIIEDHPTSLCGSHDPELDVGWFRRMPWCHCGEGHDWHWESATPHTRGASLAVVVNGGW